ncbi:MAG: PKD domain-containing protein, partial [Cyanobacteria bacterium J06600_6]
GKIEIYGAEKLDFVALKGNALKGDNELILDLPAGQNSPLGWQVGDRLALGGTRYRHTATDENNNRYHDEELTITAINGNRIRFTNKDITNGDDRVLRFNHELPEGFEDELDLYVANTTRNISFATENGENVPTKQRGHVMFMHNPDVVVQNAGFYDLGRTDKNQLIDDPGENIDGSTGFGKNPRGRYAFHFHKTGLDPNQNPALAKGNAVVGSPGWGLVHHASNAVLEDNVVFDVVGAGIVAEAGNEIGAWRNNLTMKMTGDDRRNDIDLNGPREFLFDFGFNGEGYWIQGASQIDIEDNIAISSRAGIAFFGSDAESEEFREVEKISVDILPDAWKNIAQGTADETMIDVSAVPIRKLSGFESYNSGDGIFSWGKLQNKDGQLSFNFGNDEQTNPAHDFRWTAENFKLWNIVGSGVALKYNSNVDLDNGLILGMPQRLNSSGVSVNDSSNRLNFNSLHIEGFNNGIRIPYDANKDFVGSRIENSYFANNQNNFAPTNGQLVVQKGEEDFPAFFQVEDNNIFEIESNNRLPQAKFVSQVIGGLARNFDASTSFDSDSAYLKKDSKGIISYGWDFDSDGNIDKFGRQASHHFDLPGTKDVTLTVWDREGASTSLTKTFNIQSSDYRNAFIDSSFSNLDQFAPTRESNSVYSNAGWFATSGARYDSKIGNGGAAILSGKARSAIGQVVQDNAMRRGLQTLKIDLKNTEGIMKEKFLNNVTVSLWGIDGEFDNNPYYNQGPTQAGALSMQSDKLMEQSIGGTSFDWKTFNWDVDLGDGYQFLLIQVTGAKVKDAGDYVAVDNIRLAD